MSKVVALALPYQERGETPWVTLIESFMGPDNYMVHFNRKLGVADAVLDQNRRQFLQNLYRKNEPLLPLTSVIFRSMSGLLHDTIDWWNASF